MTTQESPKPSQRTATRIHESCKRLADRYRFTMRERDVLFALACGTTSAPRLAATLNLSPNTVHNHFKGMFRRSGARSKSELLALLLRAELERGLQADDVVATAPALAFVRGREASWAR